MTITSTIPFAGFYCSIHSDELDRVLESTCDYYYEETGCDIPEFITNELWSVIDWQSVYENYSREYAASFMQWLGFDGAFDAVTSPREYNFQTDRIFVTLTRSDLARLWRMVSRGDLTAMASRRFTSRDGFISHYNPNWRTWGKLSEWDHNQIGTLMECAARAEQGGDFDQFSEYELMENAMCNGELDNWVWGSSKKATKLINIIDYLRERAKRPIRTMEQWHAARRAENRPFADTPLGTFAHVYG